MLYNREIEKKIKQFKPNEIIVARKLFCEELKNIPEATFYKVLERLVKQKTLVRISKGIYCRPKITRFGVININENEIIKYFTGESNENGMIVGYRLYNKQGLTTQISKTTEVYSNLITEEKKMVSNVTVSKLNMQLEMSEIKLIEALEILQNYYQIENMSSKSFVSYLNVMTKEYNDEATNTVLKNMKYKKKTIAFLEMILNDFGIKNTLSKYLAGTSTYKIPRMEEIYERDTLKKL